MLILFVDDDPEDFEIFCEGVQAIKPHSEVIFRSNGQMALHFLHETTSLPDCIFLDIHMPVMDGFEFLKIIKADKKTKGIPVIVYSSDVTPRTVDVVKELGAKEIIPKPSAIPVLIQLLRGVLA